MKIVSIQKSAVNHVDITQFDELHAQVVQAFHSARLIIRRRENPLRSIAESIAILRRADRRTFCAALANISRKEISR